MSRPARSAGGMPLRCGQKAKTPPPLTRAEAKAMKTDILTDPARTGQIRYFSHFDQWASDQASPNTAQAAQEALVLLGQCQFHQWRGVRPQLASLLRLVALMAKADGYNLRVVAETAIRIYPKRPRNFKPRS